MVYGNASYDYPFPLSYDHARVRVPVRDTHAQMMVDYGAAHLDLSQTTVLALDL